MRLWRGGRTVAGNDLVSPRVVIQTDASGLRIERCVVVDDEAMVEIELPITGYKLEQGVGDAGTATLTLVPHRFFVERL
jgi:hypothetical protein